MDLSPDLQTEDLRDTHVVPNHTCSQLGERVISIHAWNTSILPCQRVTICCFISDKRCYTCMNTWLHTLYISLLCTPAGFGIGFTVKS